MCAQLTVRFGLPHTTLPDKATQESGFLTQLLLEAAKRRNAAVDRVVVLVDALNEVDDTNPAPRQNRLHLPPVLPEGVVFVVTTRALQDTQAHLTVAQRREPIDLRENDPQNLADVRKSIVEFLSRMLTKCAWGLPGGMTMPTCSSTG